MRTMTVMKKTNTLIIVMAVLPLTGIACVKPAVQTSITIAAGDRARPAGPVSYQASSGLDVSKAYVLTSEGKPDIPAQADEDGKLWWWAVPMSAGQQITYKLALRPAAAVTSHVKVEPAGVGVINVTIDGKFFTAFHYEVETARPYLYPVLAASGEPVTRNYPMKDDPLEKANKRQDHNHHRSIWTAHGDVRTKDFDKRGTDYWQGERGRGHAYQEVKRIVRLVSGPVFGRIEAEIEWNTKDGHRELTEDRTYTFFRGNDTVRIIDPKIVFKFTDGDVMFADTKEGGIISTRLAVTMDEQGVEIDGKKVHGQMCNSNGQVGEEQCWGKAADWCDYVGPVDGKTVGIAIMDAKSNFRHPTTWHIRGYGLYAANPFGLSGFTNDKSKNGSCTWKKGETATFNYRILIHQGGTQDARIADEYGLYMEPPHATSR